MRSLPIVRGAAALVLSLAAVLVPVGVAGAQDGTTSSLPRRELPGTVLEAEERDDGGGSATPWLVGSGLAALAAIGVGGTVLQRRSAKHGADGGDASGGPPGGR